MTTPTPFEETTVAYQQVQAAVSQLKSKYASVCVEIAEKESELKAAPLAYLPVEDLKAGILDFIDASGERYAEDCIKGAIASFATNGMGGMSQDRSLSGKPMRFCDVEETVSGRDAVRGWAQLLTPQKHQFNDQVLYYFFAQFVKQGLAKLMEGMQPGEFGYNMIHPDKIGSDRATRRAAIASLNEQLGVLQQRRDDLKSKLAALGHHVREGAFK